MRKLLFLIICVVCSLNVNATLKTYNLEAGQYLSGVIPYTEMRSLDSVKITGVMQQNDLYYINGLCRQFGVLTYVDLSETTGIAELPSSVFENVLTLKTIILPKTVKKIGDGAFSGCPKLENVNLPDSITEIGSSAFLSDSLLNATSLPEQLKTVGETAFMECKAWGPELIIPKGCDSIGVGAFTYMQSLKTIKVEAGNTAFKSVDNLLYTADGKTLLSCAGALEGVVSVADGTEEIQPNAFAGAENITEVNIPESVSTIGDFAFDFMFGLKAINVDAGNKAYSSASGVLFDKDQSTLIIYPQGATATDYATPATVKTINKVAFANNSHLKSVKLNEGLVEIGDYAFSESPLLENVMLPSTLETMGQSVFLYCTAMKEVALPGLLTSVPDYTFGECDNLTKVTMPDGIESIGVAAFINCTALEEIKLPSELKLIYNGAFERTGLKSVTVPEGVTDIDVNVFAYSDKLKTVVMPSTLLSIGGSAFDGTTVENFTCNAVTPPSADYAFLFADLSNATLSVPAESVDLYKEAEGWKDFFKITTGIETTNIVSQSNDVKAVYDLNGRKLNGMQRGLNVVKYGNGKAKVLIKR